MSTCIDEVIGGNGKRTYNIVSADGTVLYEGVQIQKAYTPATEGTSVTAAILNAKAEKTEVTALQTDIADGTTKAYASHLQGAEIAETAVVKGNVLKYNGTMYAPDVSLSLYASGTINTGSTMDSTISIDLPFMPSIIYLKFDTQTEIQYYGFNLFATTYSSAKKIYIYYTTSGSSQVAVMCVYAWITTSDNKLNIMPYSYNSGYTTAYGSNILSKTVTYRIIG